MEVKVGTIISWDEVFHLEDVGFYLHKHEGILSSHVGNYLKHPFIMVSYLSSIPFRHPPHHPILQDNLSQSIRTYCRAQEQMGEYNTYNGCCVNIPQWSWETLAPTILICALKPRWGRNANGYTTNTHIMYLTCIYVRFLVHSEHLCICDLNFKLQQGHAHHVALQFF